MTVVNGQNIDAGDYISSSAGAADSGKIPKLDTDGKLDKSFPRRFGCKAFQSSGQSYGSSGSVLDFQTEAFDDDTMHSVVSNISRLTINTPGIWLIGASVSGSSGTNAIGLRLRLNGSSIIGYGGGGSVLGGAGLSVVRHFASADYIEVLAACGNSQTTSGDEGTHFFAILLQAD